MKLKIDVKAGTAVFLFVILAASATEIRAEIFAYPKNGQDEKTQMKDRQECQMWAQQQSGYNPASAAYAPKYTAEGAQQGSGLKGAAGGALRGAAIGGIADGDAGRGAAAGAIGGVIMGRIRSKRQQAEIAAAKNSAVHDMQAQGYGAYEKACKACLEGRGYSVN